MSSVDSLLLQLPAQGINVLDPGSHLPLLADLQGNIIKSHGRDYSVLLFLRWRPEQVEAARAWIASFASRWITSALQQFEMPGVTANLVSLDRFLDRSF